MLNPDGSTAGWSLDCSANTRVDYLYRATTGSFQPLPSDGSRPSNMAQTTLLDGRTVDYVVRRERGTIDRFIYSFAMLAPFGEAAGGDPDTSLWNRRADLHVRRRRADRPPAGHPRRQRCSTTRA